MKIFSQKDTNLFLLALLVSDVIFFIGHLVYLLNDSGGTFMLLTEEGGLPEMYQYLKFIIIILICAFLIFKRKQYAFVFWFFLFTLFFIDDAFQFHEKIGGFLKNSFDLQPNWGLRPQDWGELTYAFLCGILLIPLMVFCYKRGNRRTKRAFIDVGILLCFFLFFAVFVDTLHAYFTEAKLSIAYFFGILEDGGEMILLSIIAWYFYFLMKNPSNQKNYLFQFFLKAR